MSDNSIQRSYVGNPEVATKDREIYESELRRQGYSDPVSGFSLTVVGSGTKEDMYTNIFITRASDFHMHSIAIYILMRYVMENNLGTRYVKFLDDIVWVIDDELRFSILKSTYTTDQVIKIRDDVNRLMDIYLNQ